MTVSRSFNRRRFRILVSLTISLFVCLTRSSVSADDSHVWTVQKLNERKPWEQFVGTSKIRIEGRMGGASGGHFQLQRCDVSFTIDKQKLPSFAAKNYVEIKGQFKKEGSKLVFVVDDIKVVPSYADQFDSKATRLQRAKAEDWIALGDWVAERAKFYEDAELTKRAVDAYSKSIEVEYRSLKPTNAEGRFELAKKMGDFNLPDRRRMEMIHEGCRIQWLALQKAEPPDLNAWKQFASSLNEWLPGTNAPVKKETLSIKDAYNLDPDSVYRKASDDLRLQLHRMLFVGVMRKILVYGESDDGHDGDSIAEQIDELIPEEHPLAETYRLKRLEFGQRNIATATRSEVEVLAAAFRERHQNETAKRLLTEWIKTHESRRKGDGVVGLLLLADEYLSLLNDQSAALECLAEANKIDPTFEGVKSKLTALGYQWRNGRWVKADTTPHNISESQSPTGISIGMSASGLRNLLGQPRSLARAITARGITEVWSFGAAGSTPLVIRLEQQATDKEPKITAISGE